MRFEQGRSRDEFLAELSERKLRVSARGAGPEVMHVSRHCNARRVIGGWYYPSEVRKRHTRDQQSRRHHHGTDSPREPSPAKTRDNANECARVDCERNRLRQSGRTFWSPEPRTGTRSSWSVTSSQRPAARTRGGAGGASR